MQGNGAPGVTIGDWLVDRGLDAPRAPRIRSDTGSMRRQHLAMRSAAASVAAARPPTGGGGKQVTSPACRLF